MSKTVIDSPFPSAKRVAKKLNLSADRVRYLDIMLTDILNENLDELALTTGVPKGEHVRRAIAHYIEQSKGVDPHRSVKFKGAKKK